MRNRFKQIAYVMLGVLTALILSAGCSRRAQLSDEELAQVFHDAFLANAYINNKNMSLDSLRLYDPIFQKYGYTAEDVQYTIGSFATRKSAKLSDVVERAIAMLESRGLELDKHIEILNSIDEMAKEQTAEIIFSDSLREYRAVSDTTAMKIIIESPPIGSYDISFSYLVDTLDKTEKMYRSRSWMEMESVINKPKSKSTEKPETSKRENNEAEEAEAETETETETETEAETEAETVDPDDPEEAETEIKITRANISSTNMRRGDIIHFQRSVNSEREMARLVIELVSTDDVNEELNRQVKLKNIVVKHTPKVEQAREILFQRLVGVNIFDDELLFER